MKKTFKKALAVLLVAVMVFGSAPLAGFVGIELPEFNLFGTKADAATSGYYTYTVSDGEATITEVSTSISGSVTIPATLGGYPVTSIGSSAFRGCYSLKSVTIGNSVTSIGSDAFRGCTRLTSVTIGNSVTSIGNGAFYECSRLTSVTIPDSVTSIGDSAFSWCTGLTSVIIPDSVTSIGYDAFNQCTGLISVYYTGDIAGWCSIKFSSNPMYYANRLYLNGEKVEGEIAIPDSVTSIGNGAFYECSGLTSVTIPDSVTSIGKSAFYGCTGLKSIIIPDSVTSIGYRAFYNCTGLTSVTIGNGVTSIGNGAFFNTGLYNDSSNWESNVLYIGSYLIKAKTKISGAYTIKPGTKAIAEETFDSCYGLTNITIPDSVTNIGNYAFDGCTGLTSIIVDENNQYYSNDDYGVLFNKDKTELIQYPEGNERTEYIIPDSVTSIGDYAFDGCTGLKSVTIGNSVTSICSAAFSWCTGLTDVTIGNSVTSIGSDAFYNCTGLKSVTIGNGVTSIGNNAFNNCTNLSNTYYSGTPEQWNEISIGINNGRFAKDLIFECYSKSPYYGKGTCGDSLTWILNPNGELLIEGTGEMTDYSLDSNAPWYSMCSIIKSITIGDEVKGIGAYAFGDCTKLTSITIPDSITSIGKEAFYNTGIYNDSSKWENDVLYIGNCLIDAKTDISGNYYIKVGTKVLADEAFAYCKELTNVTISDSITKIVDRTFYNCTGLTSVIIPDSVTSIGDDAFNFCSSLSNIYYTGTPEQWSIISIGSNNGRFIKNVIFECNSERPYYGKGTCGVSLTWILYSNGELIIDGMGNMINYSSKTPWYSMRSIIKSVTIGDEVTSICDSAFSGCSGLTSVTIPAKIASVGKYAFYNCSSLTSIEIPDSITSIGRDAFCNTGIFNDSTNWENDVLYIENYLVDAKTSISGDYYIKAGTKVLADYAFDNCAALKSITIPNSVTRIGSYAFLYCNSLSITYYVGTPKQWNNVSIGTNNNYLTQNVVFECDSERPYYISGSCGENLSYVLYADGELAITGSGDMNDYTSSSSVPWSGWSEKIISVSLPGELTSIGDNAFNECDELVEFSYDGTEEEWETVSIGIGNDNLTALKVGFSEYKVSWTYDNETYNEYVKVGNELTPPSMSEKAGYSFVGWTPEIPETMPAKDMSFTAVFKANSYNAVFNANGGAWSDGETTKTVATDFDSEIIAPEAPEKQGYIFSGWSSKVGTMDDVNGKAFNAVWIASTDTRYTVETYTMNTEGEYVKTVQNYTGETDSTANAEYTVAKGFALNEEKSVLSGVISADNSLVLKIYFDRNKYTFTSVVDGTATETEYLYGSIIAEPAAPVKTGYTFAGWDKAIPASMPAKDVTITAEFDANSYDAIFNANGGKWSDGLTSKTAATDFDSEIIAPANPTRQGYDFAGWDSEIGKMDDVNGKTFSAKWTARNDTKYTVEFYTMDAYGKYSSSKETKYGTTDTEASVTANAQTGFTVNSTKSNLSGNIAGDGSLVLRIYYDRNKYKFITNIDGNTTSKDYYYDAPVTMPANPDKPGYKFIGWDKTIPSKMPANDVTVTAVFEQILFKMSIRNPSTTTIKYGDKIILHADMNEALPNGWTVKWTADNGNFSYSVSADGSTCTISPSKSGSTNFKATVYDEKGNVFCEDTQSMTSKAGFFDKIGAFFRKLFGSTKTIPQLFKGTF